MPRILLIPSDIRRYWGCTTSESLLHGGWMAASTEGRWSLSPSRLSNSVLVMLASDSVDWL